MKPDDRSRHFRTKAAWAMVAGLIAAILFYVIILGSAVRRDLSLLSVAYNDGVIWNLAQVEVEYLSLRDAIHRAASGKPDAVRNAMIWFDVLFGRIDTTLDGSQYAPLSTNVDASDSLTRIAEALDVLAPVFDAGEETILAELTTIDASLRGLWNDVRRVSLAGPELFARIGDQRREQISQTLRSIAWLTSVLFSTLLLLLVAMQKLYERSRREAHAKTLLTERLTAVVDAALDAIVVADRKGRAIEMNKVAERIFGYQIAPGSAPVQLQQMLRHADDEAAEPLSLVGEGRLRLDGVGKAQNRFPIEVSLAATSSGDDQIIVGYIRDISRDVKVEDELTDARDQAIAGERSKNRLLAVMSHEMRNPLNALIGNVELLGETALDDEQDHRLQIVRNQADLLLAQINDVLDVTRLDAGKLQLRESWFVLPELIEELVESQSVVARGNDTELIYCRDSAARTLIYGDPLRLQQVLVNLIGNAIKFTQGGQVVIEAEVVPGTYTVEIRVSDTGAGIESSELETIFDDFSTGDASYSRSSEGTGLGLAISRRLMQVMGGTIGVESEPGEGSIFWIRLPVMGADADAGARKLASNPRPGAEAASEPAAVEKALDVLLVEDNQAGRELVTAFLTRDGHRVEQAVNGADGVARAGERHFDLILMDISMPGFAGTEAARRIRAGKGPSRETRICALTAHSLDEDLARFRAAGMDGALIKPVTRNDLRRAITLASNDTREVDESAFQLSEAPGPTSGIGPPQTLNVLQINEMRAALSPEVFRGLAHQFIKETSETLAKIQVCMRAGEHANDCAYAAHQLAGSCAIFGADALSGLLGELEVEFRKGGCTDALAKAQLLHNHWQAARQEIENHILQCGAA